MSDENLTRKKLVIVGDGHCGKTSLLIVFKDGTFPETYIPTVFENSMKKLEVDGQRYELTLWDTAGQEGYVQLRPLSYEGAHVVLIAFAINNKDSHHNVGALWEPEVKKHIPTAQVILVGTKSDMREEGGKDNVSFEEGRKLAEKINAFAYMECSAKVGTGVKEVFNEAVKASLSAKMNNKKVGCGCNLF